MEKLVYTGYGGGDTSKPIKLYVTYNISQSIANNQSTITCGMYITTGSLSIGPWTDYGSYLPTTSSTFTHNLPNFSGSHTITSGRTMTVNHDSAGNATATIYWKAGYNASWGKFQKPSGSFNITLPQIPRQANLTSASDFTDEGNPTVNYSNPAGTAVDELMCGIYDDAGSVAYAGYRNVSKTGTSYTFNLTDVERDALRQACTGKSMTVRFYLKTKIGGTYYYSSIAKTMTITNGNPTLNPTVVDTNSTTIALTGSNAKLVKYFSNAQWAHNAAAVKKASISQYIMSNGGTSYNTPSGTINGVQNNSFAFTVKDSRGNITSKSLTPTMVNYVKLTADLSVKITVAGVATLICTGNYFNGSFGSQSNTLTFKYRYKELNGSYGNWTTATPSKNGNTYSISPTISGLDYRKKYVFQFNVVDKLMNVNSAEISARALPVFDWSEEDFNFNVPVTFSGGFSASFLNAIYPVGSIYISVNETNPGTLFGGTWEQIKDRFLLACGDAYINGKTGGRANHKHPTSEHTLTVEEMPSHTHSQKPISYSNGTATINCSGHYLNDNTNAWTNGRTNHVLSWPDTGANGGDKPHSHGDTGSANHLPPYLAVYMWKRTA